MYELAVFMKEAKQIEAIIASQEVWTEKQSFWVRVFGTCIMVIYLVCKLQIVMAGAELGSTVDEVESLLKRLENSEKLVSSQEEKIAALQELSDNLAGHEHFAGDVLRERVDVLCQRHERLQNLFEQRRDNLEDSRRLTQFYQDIVEV